MLAKVCIIGRPNVGKSELYNRLARRKEAIVFNTPESHVTRDYREGVGQLGDLRFRMVDTSGLEPYLPTTTLQVSGRGTDSLRHRQLSPDGDYSCIQPGPGSGNHP